MKRNIFNIVLIFLCVLQVKTYSQETKLNQTLTSNKNVGRVLNLKESFRIADDGENFFFRMPWEISMGPEGDIYVVDSNQFLRFDSQGRFVCNYFKPGQGPCELVSMGNYLLDGNHIIALGARPNKIVWINKDGQSPCTKEFRISNNFFRGRLLKYRNGKYLIVTSGIPEVKGISGFADNFNIFMEISDDGKNVRELSSFPTKTFIYQENGARYSYSTARFISKVYKEKWVVLSHTPEYQIKIFDIYQNKVIKTFSRKYDRVKFVPTKENDIAFSGRKFKETTPEYEQDIANIFALQNFIWVVTSTKNDKGTLIDVYDYNGIYRDCFYLKVNGNIMDANENSIIVREKDKDENIVLAKYLVGK